MDLNELLKKPEGKTLEFKRDLSSPNNIKRTITAFANTAGGIIVIGIEDKTHYIRGIDNPLAIEEQIANIINDNIAPHIIPEIDIIPWRNTYVVVVQVFPSSIRPHFLKKEGPQNGVYIRVGSTNRRADNTIIKDLERIAHNESFDEKPMPELSSEAIDFRAASEQFSEIRKLKPKDLETLNLLVPYQGHLVPTIGGILLFGKEREKYFPDAWIQAGRFQGHNKNHIIDSTAILDYPTVAIDAALGFLEKHAMRSIEIGKVKHQKRWSIPHAAVREAVINAVVHADYSQEGAPIRIAIFDDRIEIENPGLLRFGLTIDDIKKGLSKLRNRVIGKIFNTLGFIEQWGSGIQRIITSCKEGGFPEPLFEELGTHFRVTFYLHRDRPAKLDMSDKQILDILGDYQESGLTTSEIAKKIKLSNRATRTRLIRLIDIGYIIEIASSPQDPNRCYLLSITNYK